MADHEIIDAALYRAILHGVAAGACREAAREDRSRRAYWGALADDQSMKSRVWLHQAASAFDRGSLAARRRSSAAAANSPRVAT